ncbi:hypothetical protein GZH46_01566 [Fragariocoptes setiger]|uniref:Uncharacterized protein n=1 Tax=Fragariocoptes setiger TaxID=1670756 RepID=A0ABQ7S954_9ACAR|nr:hypothetical protein GZH46_01566 [Fragariocoptes setiger]
MKQLKRTLFTVLVVFALTTALCQAGTFVCKPPNKIKIFPSASNQQNNWEFREQHCLHECNQSRKGESFTAAFPCTNLESDLSKSCCCCVPRLNSTTTDGEKYLTIIQQVEKILNLILQYNANSFQNQVANLCNMKQLKRTLFTVLVVFALTTALCQAGTFVCEPPNKIALSPCASTQQNNWEFRKQNCLYECRTMHTGYSFKSAFPCTNEEIAMICCCCVPRLNSTTMNEYQV